MPRSRFGERAEADILSTYRTINHDNPRAADGAFKRSWAGSRLLPSTR
jgi:plasmid stabilization system protein ParE